MPEATADPRRLTSAILFADVHGYSRLMARNEERTYQRVTQAIRLIRSLIGDYGGAVQHVAGDGILALFESAAGALQFAIAIQRELYKEAVAHSDDEPVAFRIGINVGEVLLGGEANVQGHAVNVAERLQALARPGGICVTDMVQRLASEIIGGRVRRLGLRYLKNIDEPIEVFAVDVTGSEPAASSLAASAPVHLTSPVVAVELLPAQSGSLDDTYLAFVLSEALTRSLARFNWLDVEEARSSGLLGPALTAAPTEPFAGGDYVVAGSVVRVQGRIRLVARLLENPAGRIIWGSGFDLGTGQLSKSPDDLAAIVAARLERQILMAEVTKVLRMPPEHLDARDYTMRAIPLMFNMSRDSLWEAEMLFRAADEVGPPSARNRALRAFATLLRVGQQWASDPSTALEEIDWLTRSAIEHSPTDALALSLRGHAESFIFHRFDRALDCFDRALQNNPAEPFGWGFSAITLSYLGRTREAMERLLRYRELCPLDPYPFFFDTAFALTYALAGNYGKAVEIGRRAVVENPNFYAAYRPLITSLGRIGQIGEARVLLDKLLANEPHFSISWFRSKYPPVPGDQLEPYLEGFRKVGVPAN
jgi:adenylate cyclase